MHAFKQMRNRGFGLVEVMAGLLVGMVTTVVIYQVLAVSGGYERAAAGGGDAQQNGGIGLHLLERDLRQAGAGLDFGSTGSPLRTSPIGTTISANESGRNIDFTLAPVVITPGATANDSDTITVLYGKAIRGGGIRAMAPPGMASVGDDVVLLDAYGIRAGDLFIVAAPGVTGTLAQVSALNGMALVHANVAVNGFNFNAVNFPVAYPQTATVMPLGGFEANSEPALNRYEVANGKLRLTPLLRTSTADDIADNIVLLKAEYGIDATNSGQVTLYSNTLPTGVDFTQVRTIRIGIVARINAYEKQVVSSSVPVWNGGPVMTLTGDAAHYRYRSFSTTVALRNAIW